MWAPRGVEIKTGSSIQIVIVAVAVAVTPLGALVGGVGCDARPRVRVALLGNTTDQAGPYHVLAEVTDRDGVDRVWLHFIPGTAQEGVVQMSVLRGDIYEGLIQGQPPFTLVQYYVEAIDRGEHVTDPQDARSSTAALYGFWVLGGRCTADVECGTAESCDASGVCRRRQGPCALDGDCGKGRRCGPAQTCLLAARPCVLDEGCVGGEVCGKISGQCAPRPRCDGGLSCPLDFLCDVKAGLCRRTCFGGAECGPGESCQAGVCSGAKTCTTDLVCGTTTVCDPLLKYCRPRGAGLCAPCVHDLDCGGPTDFCLILGKGQYCGRDCSKSACPTSYTCDKSSTPPQCVPTSGDCQI